MTDSIIERAARALAEDDASGLRARGINAETKHWRSFEQDVRAVLQAIREPSEAMIAGSHYTLGYDGDYTALRWQAMVDAALKEAP